MTLTSCHCTVLLNVRVVATHLLCSGWLICRVQHLLVLLAALAKRYIELEAIRCRILLYLQPKAFHLLAEQRRRCRAIWAHTNHPDCLRTIRSAVRAVSHHAYLKLYLLASPQPPPPRVHREARVMHVLRRQQQPERQDRT